MTISAIDLIATANSIETKKEPKTISKSEKVAKLHLKADKLGTFLRFTGINKEYKGFLFASEFKNEKGRNVPVIGFVKDENLIDSRKSEVKKVFRIGPAIRTNNTLKTFLVDVLGHPFETIYTLLPLEGASDIYTLSVFDGESVGKVKKLKGAKSVRLGEDGLPLPKRKYTKRNF